MKHIESWSDVTIKQLKKLRDLKTENTLSNHLSLLKIFNPELDMMNIDLDEAMKEVENIYKVMQNPPLPKESTGTYKIDDVEYKLAKPEELDFGQFIDFNNLTDGQDEWGKINNLPLIIALLTEGVEDVQEFSKTLEDKLDVITGTSLLLFFSEVCNKYIEGFLQSSPSTTEKKTKRKKKQTVG